MKKIFFSFLSVAIIVTTFAFTTIQQDATPTTLAVDAKQSQVDFSGSKANGFHPGFFPVKSGNVIISEGKLTGGNFVIDVAGVKVTDGAGKMLEDHLKKADFFDVEKFSEASFEIVKVKYKKDNNVNITGFLTLKGVKSQINFDAKIRTNDGTKFFAEAFFSLNRTQFGMDYGVSKGVSADVQIGIHLFAGDFSKK